MTIDRRLVALILRAAAFAAAKHGEQKRKYSGEPYITHPLEVAARVAECTDDADVIIAAVLHDTLEDTQTTYDEIAQKFGHDVAILVYELTDRHPAGSGGNRAERKALEHARLKGVSREAKLIKVMDLQHNRADIELRDPNFAVVYIKETDALMRELVRELLLK